MEEEDKRDRSQKTDTERGGGDWFVGNSFLLFEPVFRLSDDVPLALPRVSARVYLRSFSLYFSSLGRRLLSLSLDSIIDPEKGVERPFYDLSNVVKVSTD